MSLTRSYGGLLSNPHEQHCFFCYTIFDKKYNMFYSGVKVLYNNREHNLMSGYFTTTSVSDFKERLKTSPDEFEYIVEYFDNPIAAFRAEKEYHKRYDVAKDPTYYNVINSSGSRCGAGTVLCKDEDGNTYRVSMPEYQTGNHLHISHGMINVYHVNDPTKIIKIYKEDFDSSIHTHELENMTHVYDKQLGRNVRISIEQFNADQEGRYHGVTKGMVSCYDTRDGSTRYVTKQEYDDDPDLVGFSSKRNPNRKVVSYTQNTTSVYDLMECRYVAVDKEIYKNNKHRYINSAIRRVYVLGDELIANKITLSKRWKNLEYSIVEKKDFHKLKGKKQIW